MSGDYFPTLAKHEPICSCTLESAHWLKIFHRKRRRVDDESIIFAEINFLLELHVGFSLTVCKVFCWLHILRFQRNSGDGVRVPESPNIFYLIMKSRTQVSHFLLLVSLFRRNFAAQFLFKAVRYLYVAQIFCRLFFLVCVEIIFFDGEHEWLCETWMSGEPSSLSQLRRSLRIHTREGKPGDSMNKPHCSLEISRCSIGKKALEVLINSQFFLDDEEEDENNLLLDWRLCEPDNYSYLLCRFD